MSAAGDRLKTHADAQAELVMDRVLSRSYLSRKLREAMVQALEEAADIPCVEARKIMWREKEASPQDAMATVGANIRSLIAELRGEG